MMNRIGILISICIIASSCNSKAQTDSRKELINKFISAVQKYDTVTLYAIVDTNFYFKVQDKERFLFLIDYVNERLKLCDTNIPDSSIKITNVPVNSKEYMLPFCRKNGEIVFDSFDLLFTFTDYEKDKMIHFIDVKKYRKNNTPIKQSSAPNTENK